MSRPVIAIVAYEGVAAGEADAFRTVFDAMQGAEVVTVGHRLGVVPGAGGIQTVTARLDDVRPDVVAIPGGMGSHRHREIAAWIVSVAPSYVLASSTGVALLGAAGVLAGCRVATHWLSEPLLGSMGATIVDERVVVDGALVTCQGAVSALDASLLVVRALGGEHAEMAARVEMARRLADPGRCTRSRRRWRRRRVPSSR